jgi:hypothetical protein
MKQPFLGRIDFFLPLGKEIPHIFRRDARAVGGFLKDKFEILGTHGNFSFGK